MSDIRDRDERISPSTYMTENEAKEFHKLFMMSFIIFTVVAIIAHFLVWQWRPWLGEAKAMAQLNPAVATSTVTGLA